MKRMMLAYVAWCTVALSGVIHAYDQPTLYRATFFNESPSEHIEEWTTTISARVASGSTREAFDVHEHKKPLFNAYGSLKLAHLGLGLQGLTAARPQTNVFWGVGGHFANPANLNDVANRGDAEFAGHFKAQECDLTLQQNIMWGLYLQGYLPIKDYKLDSISAKNIGTVLVNGQDMATFITTTLPVVLKENGLAPFSQPFSKSGLGDAVVSLGWHGMTDELEGIITGLSGLMQIGGLIPTGAKRDENIVFALPLGNNGHWGVVARAASELEIWDAFSLGAQVGSTMFFTQDKNLRMQTDRLKRQNGWIALEKGFANVNQGSLWDVGAYVKAGGRLVQGLALILGCSYACQERTWVHVKDANFLKDVITQQAALVPPNFVSQDDVVNNDTRLRGWQTLAVHCVVQYQPVMKLSPLFKFEYTCPVAGKYSWATDMFAGTLGLSMDWGF